jgi:hypothetical protein
MTLWERGRRNRAIWTALIAPLMAAVCFFAGAEWQQSREWHCHGRTLRQWAHEMTAHPIQHRARLRELGPEAKAALPVLISLLDCEKLRGTVLPALGSIGLAAKPAVPKVKELLEEPCPFALSTLLEIGADPEELRLVLCLAQTNGPPWFCAEAKTVLAKLDALATNSGRAIPGGCPYRDPARPGPDVSPVVH